MVKISIVVPVYDCEKYLPRCLDSIRDQLFQDWEAILVDDGSTDRSGEICEMYAEQDARFRVIHQTNMGAGMARKSGFIQTEGEYIGFVDSDDWISPDMYCEMYDKVQKYNVDMVLLSTNTGEKGGHSINNRLVKVPAGFYDRKRMEAEIFPEAISDGGFFSHNVNCGMPSKLFCRECLEPYILQSESIFIMAEDAAISYPVFFSCNSVFVCEDFDAYHAYVRENSVQRSYKKNFFETCKKWHAHMLDKCVPLWNGNLKRQIDCYFVSLALTACVNEYRYYAPNTREEKISKLKEIVSDTVFREALRQIDRKKYGKLNLLICLIRLRACWLLDLCLAVKEKRLIPQM